MVVYDLQREVDMPTGSLSSCSAPFELTISESSPANAVEMLSCRKDVVVISRSIVWLEHNFALHVQRAQEKCQLQLHQGQNNAGHDFCGSRSCLGQYFFLAHQPSLPEARVGNP